MYQETYYTLSQVTQMTDIKAHTLRVWERRYNFIVADRKSSGARIYSDDEVKKLLKVKILLSSGHKISKIVQMNEDEMFIETQKIFTMSDPDDEVFVQALIESMLDFNEELFNRIFDTLLISRGMFNTFTTVIYPFLRRVGGLWITNKIIPVNEHYISNLIRQRLIGAIDQLVVNLKEDKTVVLFLPESEGHEIALLLAYYAFKKDGWKVIYLGLRVPLEDLDVIIPKIGCNYGFTFFHLSKVQHADQLIKIVDNNPHFKLFLTGNTTLMDELIAHEQCSYLAKPQELTAVLNNIK